MLQTELTPVVLASGGLPEVTIVLPKQAVPAEEYAAEELRRHLYALIGAGPRLRGVDSSRGRGTGGVIYVNDYTAAEAAGIDVAGLRLTPEAFHLETRGGSLYLLGGGPRGVLYGVYDVLETLGCRWYTPEITHLPRCNSLTLSPLRRTAAPAFEFRDMWNWDAQDPVWWVRNRLNGWYTRVPDYMGGHMNYDLFVHTFDRLLPPEEFFDRHPEYFSEIGGVRRRESSQLCLSNPEVRRLLTARVLSRLRANPNASIISVSQNDCEGYCECPRCRAIAEEEGAQSGPILRFVNAVAEETSQEFPHVLIDTLAYWYSLDAPKVTRPHPNVRVRLCSIRCCQGHAYGTCDHPESARFLRALEGWSQITEQMYIWHYCTDFAHYPLPMPNFDELHANINLYKQYGVYGLFMQGMGEEGGGGESMALRGYVLSRLFWNPRQPVWPIIDEFLAAYYGAAAPQVRVYLDTFHQLVRTQRDVHPSLYDPPTEPLYDDTVTRPADVALATGEQQVRGEQRRQVRLLRDGLAYARLYRTCGIFRHESDVYHGDATAEDLREFDTVVRDWKAAGMLRIREGTPFDTTAQLLRNRLSAHPIAWLRDTEQQIAIVPSLGGRLLEWHAQGRQWLAPADPDNTWMLYPMSEGYAEFAVLGMYALQGWSESYRVRESNDGLTLTADLAGCNLRMTRRYHLHAGALHIDSRLENRGTAARSAGWGAALHLVPPADAVIAFTTSLGPLSYAWDALPPDTGQAVIHETDRLPLGSWNVDTAEFHLTHAWSGHPIARAILGRTAATNVLGLDLRTEVVTLEPGEAIMVRQVVDIKRK